MVNKPWYITHLEHTDYVDTDNVMMGFSDNQFMVRQYVKQWSPAFSYDSFVIEETEPMSEEEFTLETELRANRRIRSYISEDKTYKVYMTPMLMMAWISGGQAVRPFTGLEAPWGAGDLIGLRYIPKAFKQMDVAIMKLITLVRVFDGSVQRELMDGIRLLILNIMKMEDSSLVIPDNVDHLKLLGYINKFPKEVTTV